MVFFFFFSSRRRHTRFSRDWSSDVCSSDLELGYVEGQNILVEGRWYGDHTDRLPALAAELVRLNVDVIVAGTAPAPEAAQRATSAIPIVMAIHTDPIGSGLVASLPKPGKNVTGLSTLGPELV